MSMLQKGRYLFFTGAGMFFPGIILMGVIVTYGQKQSVEMGMGISISGILILVGLPLLMFAGAILFKNRRVR